MLFVIFFILLYLPVTLIFPTKVLHREKLKKHGRIILTSNHYTNVDPVLYDIKFCAKFRFMAKVELFKNFFLRALIKSAGAYPVDREKVTPTVYKTTLNLLGKGKKVFIFPEGTRNKSGSEEMSEAKSGVITFASRGEAEIIPMLLYRPPKLFRKNYIIVGDSFNIVGENPKRLTKEELQQNLDRYELAVKNLREELDAIVEAKKNKHKKHLSKTEK